LGTDLLNILNIGVTSHSNTNTLFTENIPGIAGLLGAQGPTGATGNTGPIGPTGSIV